MREIKFRGKRVDGGEWVVGFIELHLIDGDLTKIKQDAFITYDYMDKIGKVYRDRFDVIPETVGQFTGFFDDNGKEIYEDDILTQKGYWPLRIEFQKGIMWVRDLERVRYNNLILNTPIALFDFSGYKIIGNIHDDTELLVIWKEKITE